MELRLVGAAELTRVGAISADAGRCDELTRVGAIQLTHVGAMALTGVGAKELAPVGAKELTGVGATELTLVGATELTRVGATELARVGATELARVGATELARVGATELPWVGPMDGVGLPTEAAAGREGGFSLIETLVALGILGSGLLAVAQVFTTGLGALTAGGPDIIARQKATEAIESVYTARDTRTVTWDQIRNTDDDGVFLPGERELKTAGDDGLLNTADDQDAEVESVTLPGADGELGTDDDTEQALSHYSRQIEIEDVTANLRRLRVTIRYLAGSVKRSYVVETFISSFA
jgi:prepilin-type N-terminal cleavage/methylation domain-containing protein